tara:strand:- start:690 stop:2276 length:1587 start_codon:yes stop_codon:yes gene_type:complete
MGIPYYFSYLIKNHKNIINKINNNINFNNLYLDCNSIVYESIVYDNFINKSQFENYIITNVIQKIDCIIKLIDPDKTVFITFDGVPPIAKLNQQKNRRYKSWYQNKLFNEANLWDTCSITPGTLFMEKLNITIKNHYETNTYKQKILLNLSDVPGEGEHKIFEYIRKNNHKNDNTVIYGMDADLIMLSLNHLKYCESIYLYRETPQFIKFIDKSLSSEEKYLINIAELGTQIYKILSNDKINDNSNIDSDILYSKIDDYIFICFLLGNDFMPHLPAINIRLNGFTVLFDLYKELFSGEKTLIKDGKIVWSNFKLYIQKLATNEHNFLYEIYNIRNKQQKKYFPENTDEEKQNKFIQTPSWERNIERFINPYERYWEFRYYYSLFDLNVDNNKNAITNICNNYLQTLQWTYYYYSKGCVNWNHYYKYHYPPLLIDLCKHIPYFDSEIVLKEEYDILHPHVLLSYVLPRNSLNLLPDKIHNYLLKNYENQYREDYEFVYAFCKYFWEGHVKFPHLNFIELKTNVMKLINE